MKILTSSLLLAGALAGTASANGFLVNEFDARAVGRGNATTATETDPSAIYYNVGGLAVEDGTNIMITGALIAPIASYTDAASGQKTDSSTNPQVVPGVFASTKINRIVAAGIGFSTPFGLAVDWPTSSPQANVVQNVALHTFFITPSVGLNLSSAIPGLSVGAGVDLVPATIQLKQAIYLGADGTGCGGATPSCANLGATAFAMGGRLGAMYAHPSGKFSLGAMWRSDVKEDFDGNADFDAPAAYRSMIPADGKTTTSLTLPQSISGGIAYRPVEGLEVEADVVWTAWSKVKELDINVPLPSGNAGTMTISSPQHYEDTTTLRVGTEYASKLLGAAVRAGFIYDPTPVPTNYLTALLPDVDRFDLTLGGSKTFGRYGVHASLLWVLPRSRSTTSTPIYSPEYKGTYDVQAWVASVSLTAKLGD